MDIYGRLTTHPPDTGRYFGVVVGVVTNNNDPEKLGRVKVKFPWLSEEVESNWARVAGAAVGANRGLLAIPEVDDEVLMAFEHGLMEFPYVLGGLWNGKDKPPVAGGKPADTRSITTKAGHVIRLDDTGGAEKIEIIASRGRATIVLDGTSGTLTITTDADLVLESKHGAVTIKGTSIEISASNKVKVGAFDIEVAATGSLKQSGSAKAELKASGPLMLQGAVVNIN